MSVERRIESYIRRFSYLDADMREDLRQESRIAIWRAQERYDPNTGVPFEQYAFVAARNAISQYLSSYAHPLSYPRNYLALGGRHGQREPIFEDTLVSKSSIDEDEEQIDEAAIAKALQRVPRKYRLVLVGLYWDNKTEFEIAVEVGVSRMSVNNWKRRGLDILRKLLKR